MPNRSRAIKLTLIDDVGVRHTATASELTDSRDTVRGEGRAEAHTKTARSEPASSRPALTGTNCSSITSCGSRTKSPQARTLTSHREESKHATRQRKAAVNLGRQVSDTVAKETRLCHRPHRLRQRRRKAQRTRRQSARAPSKAAPTAQCGGSACGQRQPAPHGAPRLLNAEVPEGLHNWKPWGPAQGHPHRRPCGESHTLTLVQPPMQRAAELTSDAAERMLKDMTSV